MARVALLLCLATLGCASVRVPQRLAVVEERPATVRHLGVGAKDESLFVCAYHRETLDCFSYSYFQEEQAKRR